MRGLYAGSNRFSIGGLLSLTEPSNLKTLIAQIKLILTKKRGFRSSHCLRWIASPFCQSEVLFCKVHFTSFSTFSVIIWVTSVCATSSGVDRTFEGCLQSSVVCFFYRSDHCLSKCLVLKRQVETLLHACLRKQLFFFEVENVGYAPPRAPRQLKIQSNHP